jgi:hypothetical protein
MSRRAGWAALPSGLCGSATEGGALAIASARGSAPVRWRLVRSQRLKALDLLVPMQATVTTPDEKTLSVGSFMTVSREKLRALDGEALAKLAKTDELELAYLHLYSMRNFNEVKDRRVGALAQAAEPKPTQEAVVDAA